MTGVCFTNQTEKKKKKKTNPKRNQNQKILIRIAQPGHWKAIYQELNIFLAEFIPEKPLKIVLFTKGVIKRLNWPKSQKLEICVEFINTNKS